MSFGHLMKIWQILVSNAIITKITWYSYVFLQSSISNKTLVTFPKTTNGRRFFLGKNEILRARVCSSSAVI